MAFIDHSYKTGVIEDESLGDVGLPPNTPGGYPPRGGFEEELTAPPEGSIFTCEWTQHSHGYYSIGCRPGKETYLDVDAVEEFEFCPYCSGEIDMWNAVADGEGSEEGEL